LSELEGGGGVYILSYYKKEILKMTTGDLEQRVKNLEETNKSLKHEVERLQAVNEIRNLVSKVQYLHSANRHSDTYEFFAKNTPGVRTYWGEQGYWEGPDAPQRQGAIMDRGGEKDIGGMAVHTLTLPVIEVAGDGKTAKGVWTGNGFLVMPDKETGKVKDKASWEWDKYGIDFVKEDGKWKLWHYHVYRFFRTGWDKGLTDWDPDAKVDLHIPKGLEPDGPAIDDYPYRPDAEPKLAPVPPEPYETWEDTTSY
jgi:hypothetical protein